MKSFTLYLSFSVVVAVMATTDMNSVAPATDGDARIMASSGGGPADLGPS